MRTTSLPSLIRRATAASLAGVTAIAVATFAFPGAAQAASNHSISGETWSSSTEWYNSSTVRTKAGTGSVKVDLPTTPCWLDGNGKCSTYDSMKWQLLTPSGNVISGSYTTGIQRSDSTTIVSLSNGTQFRNAFARGTTCFTNCRHTFSGAQYY